VALAEDGAEASPDVAEGEEDCEQAARPAAPASSAQPAKTDLRIVDDMLRPRVVAWMVCYTRIRPCAPLQGVMPRSDLRHGWHPGRNQGIIGGRSFPASCSGARL